MTKQQAIRKIEQDTLPASQGNPLAWFALIIIALICYLLFFGERKHLNNTTEELATTSATPNESSIAETHDATHEVTTPVAPQGETDPSGRAARTLINDYKNKGKVDINYTYRKATDYYQSGQLTDAYILYFYLARQGDAQSAFMLASMADPKYHSKTTSFLDKPEPLQAFKWYTAAHKLGHKQAAKRLSELKLWLEAHAQKGDISAQNLLLNWR